MCLGNFTNFTSNEMDVDTDTAVVVGAFVAGVALVIGENGEEGQVQEVLEG